MPTLTSLVSIVTVCRNDYNGLLRTYKSVCAQDRSLFEWIIVDGASNDGTRDYLSSLNAGVARWISEPDQGIYDAMNKGIHLSSKEYCIFMNAGDEFAAANTLSEMAAALHGSNEMVYGDAIEVFETLEAYKTAYPASRHWRSMFTHHQAIFYKRDAIVAGYDTSFRLAADWALTSKLLMNGARACHVAAPICRFHRGGSSENKDLRDLANRELWRIYREVHRRSLVASTVLYAVKRLANVIRFSAKPVYRRIRMKPVRSVKAQR